jgi:hypothetical protein
MPKYEPNSREKCLHCQTVVKFERPANEQWWIRVIANNQQIEVTFAQCPSCQKVIATIEELNYSEGNPDYVAISEQVVWPLSSGRAPAPKEVPFNLASDYNEASLVLPFSSKASAALSRRCLQSLLSEAAKTKAKDLSQQIDEVLPSLPSYIAENLDAIRNIGNFAAHQQKSTSTGMILDVEPGEADWNLDVLDTLFDFYYVRPEIERKKREELERKLKEAGKPSMKKP